jgi:4-phosphopantoate--beta-alanine ligase
MKFSKRHPRYASLLQREALVKGYEAGVTALAGLIAHGRGEAFDYILGEATPPMAEKAIEAAAALLLLAEKPVISVNGNTAVLCPKELVRLARAVGAELEVNLFYRSKKRVELIAAILRSHGAERVYGISSRKEIPGVASARRLADEAIYKSDVVLVPLEDGDRTEALVKAGKRVIAIDLNPLSRTARAANITIVDNVVRAVPRLIEKAEELREKPAEDLEKIVSAFDNQRNLEEVTRYIVRRYCL